MPMTAHITLYYIIWMDLETRVSTNVIYLSHDLHGDVVEYGAQHHRQRVGVVFDELPVALGHQRGSHHSEDHQGVGEADDDRSAFTHIHSDSTERPLSIIILFFLLHCLVLY